MKEYHAYISVSVYKLVPLPLLPTPNQAPTHQSYTYDPHYLCFVVVPGHACSRTLAHNKLASDANMTTFVIATKVTNNVRILQLQPHT